MSTPLATATNAEKATFLGNLNIACERLIGFGKWRGLRQRVDLPIHNGRITLPRYLESCLGVKLSTCWVEPRILYAMQYPFSVATDEVCTTGVIPVSETAQTFIIPASGFQLKVTSLLSDNGKTVSLVGGTDVDGNPIYATETLTLSSAIPPTSTTVYGSLPTIQKQATASPVDLYSVISGTPELIGIYAPSETIPAYKQYTIGNVGTETTASALCKLAFVPASADTDLIFPSVLGGLLHGLKAVQYELKSDDRYANEWAMAKKILEDDREELDGANMPVIRTVGEFGAGSIQNLVGDYWGVPAQYSDCNCP